MRHMPGVRRGAQAPGGSISILRTIASPRTVTSRWRGGVILATSVRSTEFSWAVPAIHWTREWMLSRFHRLERKAKPRAVALERVIVHTEAQMRPLLPHL